jgi:hypothetical protein
MTQVAEDEEKKKRESEALAPLEDLIGDEEEEAEENEEDEEISLEFQRKGKFYWPFTSSVERSRRG